MKKIALVFFLSIFFLNTKAQTSVYHPFPDSNASWCDIWGYSSNCCFCGGPDREAHAFYYLMGQTVQNSKLYNVLNRYKVFIEYCPPDTSIYTTPYYIRQDIAQRKVWIYDGTIETILYDFNLHVGDTLDSTRVYWGDPPSLQSNNSVVTSIDSILINGQYRTRYNYHPPLGCGGSPDWAIVEGIGSLSGLLNVPSCFEYYSALVEFRQDNLSLYGSQASWCIWANIKNSEDEKLFSITPNPSTNKFTISFSKTMSHASLKIFNMMGEEVYAVAVGSSSKQEIEIGNLAKGIYFVQVGTNERQWVEKVVVE